MRGKRRYYQCRIAFIICAALLGALLPEEVRAENGAEGRTIVTKEIRHLHDGDRTDSSGCYTKAVRHKHTGNAGAGGGCYTYPIYHLHTGAAVEGGGCFGEKVYHVHGGSVTAGGACYKTPVYHAHKGDSNTGGGCYNVPVPHLHKGTQAAGGECYGAVYHSHGASCYREETCSMRYEGGLKIERTYDMYCYHHGNTQHASITASYSHSACGQGIAQGSKDLCWTCQNKDKVHSYTRTVCGKTESTVTGYQLSCTKGANAVDSWRLGCGRTTSTVEGYRLSCAKTGQSVDAYKRNCGKNGSSVDAYALGCKKTEDTIEYYEPGCGKSEGESIGVLTLVNTDTAWTSGKVVLEASYAVQAGGDGFLQVREEAFLWEDGGSQERDGLQEGSGPQKGADSSRREVSENGVYTVRLNTSNENVATEDLQLSIAVSNIDKTAPGIEELTYSREPGVSSNVIRILARDLQPDGGEGSGLAAEPYSYDGGTVWCSAAEREIKGNGTVLIRVRDNCGNMTEASADIDNIKIEEIPEKPKEEPEKPKEEPEKPKEEPEKPKEEPEKPKEEPEKPKEEPEKPEKRPEESREEPKGEGGAQAGKPEGGQDKAGNGGGNGSGQENIGGQDNIRQPDKSALIREPLPVPASRPVKASKGVPRRTAEEQPGKKETAQNGKPKVVLAEKKEEVKPEPVLTEQPEEIMEIKTVKSSPIPPVAKAVAFTLSSVIGTASLLWLLYVLLRNIKVYHNNGEGTCRYAGSCIIRKKEDVYAVTIPDMILEQSDTGQYILRPSCFFTKKNKGKELIIDAGRHRESVWIAREIPFRV